MSSRVLGRPRAARRRSAADVRPTAALFEPGFVRHLFNQLADSYSWHQWMSLGLTNYWRQQAAALLPALPPTATVVDLMSGSGEMWPALRRRLGAQTQLHAVDFAPAMLAGAARRLDADARHARTELHLADALRCPLPGGAADAVVCGYGLKTLDSSRYAALAAEARRLLRPGGTVLLLELTLPAQGWRRAAFWRYLQLVLPLVAWLSRGRAALHRYLPFYAHAFPDLDAVADALRAAGFGHLRRVPLLLGCATALTGVRAR
ncbi:methyltransferase domain-containing protein [Hymenobacter gummosus]|uniref:Methyltransferase domain-containing protein n=1 Tax=Hymenobacter gummosus TaxID=1776032 RepID=A0A431U5A3_9BACT|nr:class I SAM-dependent methyltransferase [Hymenobacter gummosus]RTQ51484.1 methyltransferase domain-containing protein [Hymenobacter gummosus]